MPVHNQEFFDLRLLCKMLAVALDVPRFESEEYLWYVGEKAYNLELCFDIREGFVRNEDRLPRRMHTEPLKGGIRNGEVMRKPNAIIDEYYDARGWDRNGIPKRETLTRLGLEAIDKDVARFRP